MLYRVRSSALAKKLDFSTKKLTMNFLDVLLNILMVFLLHDHQYYYKTFLICKTQNRKKIGFIKFHRFFSFFVFCSSLTPLAMGMGECEWPWAWAMGVKKENLKTQQNFTSHQISSSTHFPLNFLGFNLHFSRKN